MNTKKNEFIMPALGRSAFLGQLYNARTDQLLNTQLFEQKDLDRGFREERIGSTSLTFAEIKSQSDRSRALHASAELSVSILSGFVSLAGAGEYVDTGKSNAWSHEVIATCTVQKTNRRLDVGHCVGEHKWKHVTGMGATHVVTAIHYGGSLVASVVRRESVSESRRDIKGSLQASLLKGFILCHAEGSVSVDATDIGHDFNASCSFKVYGDWVPKDDELPTTIGEVLELIKKWPSVIGDGVPCTITLTPIAQFVDTAPETMILHELEQDKLMNICRAYDEFFRLSARRARLVSLAKGGIGVYCPTFLKECRDRKLEVEKSVGKARQELSEYLLAFRKGRASQLEGVEEFLVRMKKDFNAAVHACKTDEARLDLLASIGSLATDQSAPLVTIEQLQTYMTGISSGPIGVVIIPPSPNLSNVTNTFGLLVQCIRSWREEEDKKVKNADGSPQKTSFVAYFSDPELDAEFLSLEGKRDVLNRGLEQAKRSGESCFLHYGLLSDISIQKEYDWRLLNDDGWGWMTSQIENYYYIGDVKTGKRHGRGTITYADGSVYAGDWWQDARHGKGRLTEDDGNVIEGVFIDNIHRPDGVVVELTTFTKDEVPLVAYNIPLRKYDSTPSHVLRIGNMLGWLAKDEFRLDVSSKAKLFQPMTVEVRGKMLKPGSDDKAYTQPWPLGEGVVVVKATMM